MSKRSLFVKMHHAALRAMAFISAYGKAASIESPDTTAASIFSNHLVGVGQIDVKRHSFEAQLTRGGFAEAGAAIGAKMDLFLNLHAQTFRIRFAIVLVATFACSTRARGQFCI